MRPQLHSYQRDGSRRRGSGITKGGSSAPFVVPLPLEWTYTWRSSISWRRGRGHSRRRWRDLCQSSRLRKVIQTSTRPLMTMGEFDYIDFNFGVLAPLSTIFQLYHVNKCFGGGSQSTWSESPIMGKELLNFITCDCESSASFSVISKAVHEPTPYWW